MSLTTLASKGIRYVRDSSIRIMAAYPWPRKLLNNLYCNLTPRQKSIFHREFSWIFRDSSIRGREGFWEVKFAGKNVRVPMSSEEFWLDWDTALAILGHDIEVIQTYEAMINSDKKPDLFIDIGANYGIHSLLFLMHKIKTLSFEPNPMCHHFFKRLCAANNVLPNLESVALGEEKEIVTLSYPACDTWLGTTQADVAQKLSLKHQLVSINVKQQKLDDYQSLIGNLRTLIKIDAEGNELQILKGSTRTILENQPVIIFECWINNHRQELFNLFHARGYVICDIPWNPNGKYIPLNSDQFFTSPANDFVAIPA
jgi:FkbM family methyltransferase